MANIIPLQLELSQSVPYVSGNLDYRIFKNNLERINELLFLSGIDNKIMQYEIDQVEKIEKKSRK